MVVMQQTSVFNTFWVRDSTKRRQNRCIKLSFSLKPHIKVTFPLINKFSKQFVL